MFEEEYFKNRKFEDKHYKETMVWIDYFDINENWDILDYGCGLGFYSHALRYLGIPNVWGYEISEYACKHGYGLMKNRIEWCDYDLREYNFIICYDVLEHISEDKISKILKELYSLLKEKGKILFSICWRGNPMWKYDKTHITYKSKEWWKYQIRKTGFKVKDAPKDFLFHYQMLIGEK